MIDLRFGKRKTNGAFRQFANDLHADSSRPSNRSARKNFNRNETEETAVLLLTTEPGSFRLEKLHAAPHARWMVSLGALPEKQDWSESKEVYKRSVCHN